MTSVHSILFGAKAYMCASCDQEACGGSCHGTISQCWMIDVIDDYEKEIKHLPDPQEEVNDKLIDVVKVFINEGDKLAKGFILMEKAFKIACKKLAQQSLTAELWEKEILKEVKKSKWIS